LLRLWRETGATVLLITHALDEAAMLSDRVGGDVGGPGLFIDIVETGWSASVTAASSPPAVRQITARLWDRLRVESMKLMGRPTIELAQERTGSMTYGRPHPVGRDRRLHRADRDAVPRQHHPGR